MKPNRVIPLDSPSGPVRRADVAQRRARRRFYLLLVPVFLRIVWLHCVCSQARQFTRLGRRRTSPASPLPESWARWAAFRVGKIVDRIPALRRRPCYWRSQLLYDLLPRFGFPAELHLGVLLEGDKMTPHLWVSTLGSVLVDGSDCAPRYTELAAYSTEIRYDQSDSDPGL
jgi:hypothetical protein